jgi:hypothetical protein
MKYGSYTGFEVHELGIFKKLFELIFLKKTMIQHIFSYNI